MSRRDAKRHTAVVVPPLTARRDERPQIATMGIEARSEEPQRVKHQLLHAGNRLLQQDLAAVKPETICSIIIGDTDVNVQPAPGLAQKGLRHEGGLHPC